jgi:hypothetical protein
MRIRNSSLGWALAALHAGYLLGVLASKPYEPYPGPQPPGQMSFSAWHVFGTMIAGRYFHHEPLLTDIVMIADLPALIPGWLVVFALESFIHPVASSYAAAAVWILGGSLQWYLIGLALARRVRRSASAATASASTS